MNQELDAENAFRRVMTDHFYEILGEDVVDMSNEDFDSRPSHATSCKGRIVYKILGISTSSGFNRRSTVAHWDALKDVYDDAAEKLRVTLEHQFDGADMLDIGTILLYRPLFERRADANAALLELFSGEFGCLGRLEILERVAAARILSVELGS